MRFRVAGRSGGVLAALLLAAVLAACGAAGSEVGGGPGPPGRQCPTAVAGADRSGARPVFYVADAGGCSAHAYDYTGTRTGGRLAFPSCIEACRGPVVAPDGWVPSGPDTSGGLSSTIWATDSRHRCGFPEGAVRPIRVGWFDVRASQDHHVANFTGLFDSAATVGLVGCDVAGDRAVLTSGSASSIVDAVAVTSLSRSKVLFERHFASGARSRVTAVSVAPNGRAMAVQHADQAPPRPQTPVPASCSPTTRAGRPLTMCAVSPEAGAPFPVPTAVELYALSGVPHLVCRVPGREIVGWSGDGSRLITQPGSAPGGGVTVQRVGDGQVVWQTPGTFNRALSAPGLATIAIQTFDPSRRQSSIDLIDQLGLAKHLDDPGQLVTPEP